MQVRRLLGVAGVLAALGAIGAYLALRPGPPAVTHWLPSDAAMVRCGAAGLDADTLTLLRQVPRPDPPSETFVPDLHPQALWELGYQETAPVCAALLSPSPGTLRAVARAPERLQATRDGLDDALRRAKLDGACICEAARRNGVTELFPRCVHARPSGCKAGDAAAEAMAQAMAEAEEAMVAITLPIEHWRVVGRAEQTDVPLRFFGRIAGWYEGGSILYRADSPEDRRTAPRPVAALLDRPGVLGVAEHRGRQSLVVFRDVEDTLLVVDTFTRPPIPKAWQAWVRRVDAVRTDRFVNALAAPTDPLAAMPMDPREGPTFAFDGEGLRRVDEVARVGALDGIVPRPQRDAAVVERVVVQLPTAWRGDGLRVRAELTGVATGTLAPLADRPLVDGLGGIEPPARPPDPTGDPARWRYYGTPIESTWFEGARGFPWTIAQLAAGRTFRGTVAEWSIEVAAGPLSNLSATDGMQGIASLMSARRHTVRGGLSDDATSLWVEVAPP